MTDTALTFGTFTIKRHYEASPEDVFRAFSDPAARRRWYIEGDGWTIHAYEPPADLKPGAVERSRFSPPNSDVVLTNDTVFMEVEENALLIFAYAMTLAGAPLSTSLATVELVAEKDGTLLKFTEQGIYRDGNVAGREEGMKELLEALAKEIQSQR